MVVALNFSNHYLEYAEVDVTKESQKKVLQSKESHNMCQSIVTKEERSYKLCILI